MHAPSPFILHYVSQLSSLITHLILILVPAHYSVDTNFTAHLISMLAPSPCLLCHTSQLPSNITAYFIMLHMSLHHSIDSNFTAYSFPCLHHHLPHHNAYATTPFIWSPT